MKTQPVVPAHIVFGADAGSAHDGDAGSADDGDAGAPPYAPDFGDLYHPRIGALAQARHVFLHGNGLPGRWAGQADFTVLETGFGLGHNFLATWQAWREDPARGERLHYVAVDRHPPCRDDLARAHRHSPLAVLARQLVDAWPPLTPNLHPLAFDGGRVRLLLGWGEAHALLRELELQADAIYLDGFAPDRNPAMWSRPLIEAVARRARVGAHAATWSVARPVREALAAAGFVVETAPGLGGKRQVMHARYTPAFTPRRPPLRRAAAQAAERHALVVGGGLAGAAVARALAGLGWTCTVLDRHAEPAQEASGNPAGLFHGTVHADDGPHARFNRAAALYAARTLRAAFAAGVPGNADGMLRLGRAGDDAAAMQALLARQRLPAAVVQALDAEAAGALAGVALAAPAWWHGAGGWAAPGAVVRHWLATPGAAWRGGVAVDRLLPRGARWALLDARGATLAEASTVVLAAAADAARLAAPWCGALPPLRRTRGQLSWWPQAVAGMPMPRRPLAGDGYALALPGGGLLCGATVAEDDDEALPRARDDHHNLERLLRLTGSADSPDSPDSAHWPAPQARVGWRLATTDRLPLAGALPARDIPPGTRLDQARFVPRCPGLYIAAALGSRGLGWAPLVGEVLAAAIAGTPLPLEADLLDALDPARALVRAARRGG